MDNDKKKSNLGDEILEIVQSAVNSNDFTKLNSEIRTSVDTALKEVREILKYKEPGKPVQQKPAEPSGAQQSVGNNVHVSFMSSGTVQYRPPVKTETPAGVNTVPQGTSSQNKLSSAPKLVGKEKVVNYSATQTPAAKADTGLIPVPHRPRYKTSGTLLAVSGAVITGGTVGACVLGLISTGAAGMFVSPVMIPVGIAMWAYGKSLSSLNNRFWIYYVILKRKGFADITELSRAVGKSNAFVIKDLKRMMRKGMFVEGHFDDKCTCFIANNSSYNQYRTAQDSFYIKKQEEPNTIIDESKIKNDKVKAVIKEGNDYIAKIRHINDELPDEEISKKLDTLETAITKIYFQVEQHPEQLPELDKFLKYYMPTTMKLLDVYCDFDKQPIQGENITTAKKEILGSLDTINQAFIKLFDSLFQATAWDVSTDITVLQTLLANEGLTDTIKTSKGEV